MRPGKYILYILIILLASGCITQFIPETDEDEELLVVEGLITDQPEFNTIKLSRSFPLGKKNIAKPVRGSVVTIEDDGGNIFNLTEKEPGTYYTDTSEFRGIPGRKYKLRIFSNNTSFSNYSYESPFIEMKSVPPIDSLYYTKVLIREKEGFFQKLEGCQVYLNTTDPESNTNFYRWDFTETWIVRIPFGVPNHTCWVTNNSGTINIKNTSILSENRISKYPLCFISNETDRLKERYSLLVNQYSLNQDEFSYWEKLQNVSEDVGSLYDITPASIPGNIFCIENPNEKVLGYFSVSGKSSKRFFISDWFSGVVNPYKACDVDTVFGTNPIPYLNVSVWLLEENLDARPPYRYITKEKGCADCTVRGSNVKPDFWVDEN